MSKKNSVYTIILRCKSRKLLIFRPFLAQLPQSNKVKILLLLGLKKVSCDKSTTGREGWVTKKDVGKLSPN